jgi:hypothetical protein
MLTLGLGPHFAIRRNHDYDCAIPRDHH